MRIDRRTDMTKLMRLKWIVEDKNVAGLGNNPIKVLELGALKYGISLARERENCFI